MNIRFLIITLSLALPLSSCGIDDNLSSKSAGQTINFSISDYGTRTTYDGNPSTSSGQKIEWMTGDKVDVFCNEAENAMVAEYNVVKNTYSLSSSSSFESGRLTPSTSTSLQWGSDDGIHNFYATYPAGVASVSPAGIATFPIRHQQTVTVKTTLSFFGGLEFSSPEMSNAYMVAKKSTVPVNNVGMTFSSLMTTLRIRVRPEEDTWNIFGSTRIYAVSVVKEDARSSYADSLMYDINTSSLIESGSTITQEYKASINNTNYSPAVNYLDLRGSVLSQWLGTGQKLWLYVYLPPFEINSDHPVKIRVYFDDDDPTSYLQIQLSENIPAGSIKDIELPRLANPNQN